MHLPGLGVATATWTDAAGGFWAIRGVDFTEPYPAHVHARLALAVVDRGVFTLRTTEGTHVAVPDSVIALNAYRVHEEYWDHGDFRVVFLSSENIRRATPALAPDATEPVFPTPVFVHPPLAHSLRLLHDAVQGGASVTVVESQLALLVASMRATAWMMNARSRPHTTPVALVRDRLHSGIAEPPTIEDLARVARQSPFHFIRTFRNEVGLPPFAYFGQLRIASAKEWLAQGRTIADVSSRLGFCDQSHFTRTFRRSALVPPGVWSRMLARTNGAR